MSSVGIILYVSTIIYQCWCLWLVQDLKTDDYFHTSPQIIHKESLRRWKFSLFFQLVSWHIWKSFHLAFKYSETVKMCLVELFGTFVSFCFSIITNRSKMFECSNRYVESCKLFFSFSYIWFTNILVSVIKLAINDDIWKSFVFHRDNEYSSNHSLVPKE